MKHPGCDLGRLAVELASLPGLGREELIERWRKLYGTMPPVRVRNNFLISAIAYRLQEQALGGLKPSVKRFLEKTGANAAAGQKLPMLAADIRPGTRLLREWHGVMHEVLMLEQSVQYNGKCYRSLSEVAHTITGAKWSGPLFFGLKRKGKVV